MTCYEIARKIMDRIRQLPSYNSITTSSYCGVFYYDSSEGVEYFTLDYDGVRIRAMNGSIYTIEVHEPRGIVHINLRLWLLQIDRMTK